MRTFPRPAPAPTAVDATAIVFDFQLQRRTAEVSAGKLATAIKAACDEWKHPFVTVARIPIRPARL